MLNVNSHIKLLLVTFFATVSITLQAEPTKKETINFINQKFKEYGSDVYWAKNHSQTKIRVKCTDNGICFFKQSLDQNSDKQNTTHKFNLKDIDISRIEVNQYGYRDYEYTINLYCKDIKGECITTIDGDINGKKEAIEIGGTLSGLYFYIKYESQAKKVKKAFYYLVSKYSNKKELF